MKFAVVFSTIVLGLVLLLLSTLWANMFPGTSSWTDAKAQRAAEVKARLAYLKGTLDSPRLRMHAGPDPASLKTEYDALLKEEQRLNAEFESVAQSPKTASRILKWSGISLAVVGILGWYAVKQSE